MATVKAVREAIVNVLADANTNTADVDLSGGLQVRVAAIGKGNENTPEEQLPFVLVSPLRKEVEPSQIGSQTRRDQEYEFAIFSMVNEFANAESAQDEILILTENIEKILLNAPDLSATCHYSAPGTVDWSFEENNGAFNPSGTVNLTARTWSDPT